MIKSFFASTLKSLPSVNCVPDYVSSEHVDTVRLYPQRQSVGVYIGQYFAVSTDGSKLISFQDTSGKYSLDLFVRNNNEYVLTDSLVVVDSPPGLLFRLIEVNFINESQGELQALANYDSGSDRPTLFKVKINPDNTLSLDGVITPYAINGEWLIRKKIKLNSNVITTGVYCRKNLNAVNNQIDLYLGESNKIGSFQNLNSLNVSRVLADNVIAGAYRYYENDIEAPENYQNYIGIGNALLGTDAFFRVDLSGIRAEQVKTSLSPNGELFVYSTTEKYLQLMLRNGTEYIEFQRIVPTCGTLHELYASNNYIFVASESGDKYYYTVYAFNSTTEYFEVVANYHESNDQRPIPRYLIINEPTNTAFVFGTKQQFLTNNSLFHFPIPPIPDKTLTEVRQGIINRLLGIVGGILGGVLG